MTTESFKNADSAPTKAVVVSPCTKTSPVIFIKIITNSFKIKDVVFQENYIF